MAVVSIVAVAVAAVVLNFVTVKVAVKSVFLCVTTATFHFC